MDKDPDQLRRQITETRDRMRAAITGSVEQVRSVASRASDALPDAGAVRENPLAIFLSMAAVGFIIGSLIPITPVENERLAPLADRMRERALSSVKNAMG